MAETHKGFGLLFEMGCGKTLTAIMIAGTAYQMGKVEKVLVVAPTSVCSVWPRTSQNLQTLRRTSRYCSLQHSNGVSLRMMYSQRMRSVLSL